ncbi:MAG: hypothetical protein ACI9KE_003837 [Polyangiales bacterium]|jgi:hypothetical protein
MKRLLVIALLGACASSSSGEPSAPSLDGGSTDGGADSAPDANTFCESQFPLLGCSFSDDRWLWNGSECVSAFECADRGHATESECRRAYVSCGAEPPDIECNIAIPCDSEGCEIACDDEGAYCDCPPTYVLYRYEYGCSEVGGTVWAFGLVPRVEAANIRRGVGELRNPVGVPALSIDIRLPVGDADPFHDPWRLDVGDPRIAVERCSFEGCESPSEGFFEIETGGVGEVRVLLRFVFAEEEVVLAPRWFSIDDARDGC